MSTLPVVAGRRYVVPFREGGSVPAVVDTSDDRTYVVKFKGAGQGARALVAEVIVALLARALGLPVPQPALVDLAAGFGNNEPDPEIQDILRGSVGLNAGLEYLAGALGFDPAIDHDIDPELAADIVWFDSYTINIDRTPRNPNILIWDGRPWLIDHGAALYFHHGWHNWQGRIQTPFPQIKDHVLLGVAGPLEDADSRLRPLLTDELLGEAVAVVPEEWLDPVNGVGDAGAQREAYLIWFRERLTGPNDWLATAIEARREGPAPYRKRDTHRVV